MNTNDDASTTASSPQADATVFLWGASLLAATVFLSVLLLSGFRFPGVAGSGSPEMQRHLADFSFTERGGQTVARDEFRGKFLVVNFVHTGCSISCAMVNRQMAKVQGMVAEQADVQLLSFTVDPGTDTPAALAKFAEQFGADKRRWMFLTGSKAAMYGFIESSFLSRDTNSTYMAMPGGFRKADHIAVVDPDGVLRQLLPGTKSGTPLKIVQSIEELRAALKAR